MTIALWISQGLLAALFLVSGSLKSTQSKQRMLDTGQTGVVFFPLPVIRVVAVAELAAVAGLILPAATGIAPGLTPAAAIGLAVVMAGAAISHAKLREYGTSAVNLLVLAICVFVAVGRMAG